MRTILAILLCLPLLIMAQVPPPAPASVQDVIDGTATYKFVSPASLSGAGITGGGGGAAVSNAYNLTFDANIRYTNDTDYYVEVGISVQYNVAAANLCSTTFAVDTNVTSGTYDYSRLHVFNGVSLAGTFRDTTFEMVPPRAAFRITDTSAGSSTVTIVTSEGSLMYFSTNSGGGGSGGGGSGDVTQAGLAAGSIPTGGKVRLIHNGISTNSFTTITSAKSAAVAGDLIWVEPGNYYENNLLKSNVNYHFVPGVNIIYTNTSATDWAIFDDRATGPTTNIITGAANIYWRSWYDTTHADSCIKLTNANTYFIATFGRIVGDSSPTNGEPPYLIAAFGTNSWVSITADYLGTGSLAESGQILGGVWWTMGEMYLNVKHIGEFVEYGVWPSDIVGTVTNNLWVTSDLVECYIYADAQSLNFKTWWDVKEFRMTTNGTVKDAFGLFGGRHYIKAEKISSPGVFGLSLPHNVVFYVTAGAEVWLDAQKITRNGYSTTAIRNAPGSKIFANILHFEDTTTNTTPMIDNQGEMWLSGATYKGRAPLISTASTSSTRLSALEVISTNAPAGVFADTNLVIVGSSLKTLATTNATIFSGSATNLDAYPALPFGVLYRTNFNGSVVYTTTPLPVTNWNFAQLNGFTANVATGQLTNNVPGWYKVDFRIGLAANDTDSVSIGLAVYKNGVKEIANSVSDSQFLLSVDLAPIPDQRWFFFSDVVWLPAGTAVDVRLEATSPTDLDQFSGRLIITKL